MNRAWMQRAVVFLLVGLLILGLIARVSCPQKSAKPPVRPAGSGSSQAGDEPPPSAPSDEPTAPTGKGVGPAKDPGWVKARQALLGAIDRARRSRLAAPPAHPTAADDDAGESLGELDRGYIKTQVREIRGLLAECYEMAVHEKPALEAGGKITVSFDIEAEDQAGGLVTNSKIEDGSLAGEATIADCVRETMYAVKFERPPTGGGIVHVRYPFEFRMSGEGAPDGG